MGAKRVDKLIRHKERMSLLLVKMKDKSKNNILAMVASLKNDNSFTFAVFIHMVLYAIFAIIIQKISSAH